MGLRSLRRDGSVEVVARCTRTSPQGWKRVLGLVLAVHVGVRFGAAPLRWLTSPLDIWLAVVTGRPRTSPDGQRRRADDLRLSVDRGGIGSDPDCWTG